MPNDKNIVVYRDKRKPRGESVFFTPAMPVVTFCLVISSIRNCLIVSRNGAISAF